MKETLISARSVSMIRVTSIKIIFEISRLNEVESWHGGCSYCFNSVFLLLDRSALSALAVQPRDNHNKMCLTQTWFFFLWRYSPNLGLGLPPWNCPFHFSLLDLKHSVGLRGRVISSSQGLYLYTNTTLNIHALNGIRTYYPGLRASEDSACLRPTGSAALTSLCN
jgi:hypothetical protein